MSDLSPEKIKELKDSGHFDADWYCATYPDMNGLDIDPFDHYLRYGHRLNRDPGPNFNTRFLRSIYNLREEFEPVTRLSWRKRKAEGVLAPNHKRVLKAANEVAKRGNYAHGIALAQEHLPKNLAYSANILQANAALMAGDEAKWTSHLNAYLAKFKVAPIRLEGTGSLFDRLATPTLPVVADGPLISVLIPAWNAENTIGKAAQSILRQTWQNLELLIVDDCSTDGTWRVLKEIAAKDARVKILRNKVNVGPYVSKNIALTQAQGAWITGHDADDWAHPQRLELHYKEAQTHNVKASMSCMIRIQPEGYFSFIGQLSSFSPDGVIRKASISTLFERSVLTEKLGFWDSVRFAADSEMIGRAEIYLGQPMHCMNSVSMLCLDLETSLTNHASMGVSKNTGISPVRANYRDSWDNWHKEQTGAENLYLPLLQDVRRYDADASMTVPKDAAAANVNAAAEMVQAQLDAQKEHTE